MIEQSLEPLICIMIGAIDRWVNGDYNNVDPRYDVAIGGDNDVILSRTSEAHVGI